MFPFTPYFCTYHSLRLRMHVRKGCSLSSASHSLCLRLRERNNHPAANHFLLQQSTHPCSKPLTPSEAACEERGHPIASLGGHELPLCQVVVQVMLQPLHKGRGAHKWALHECTTETMKKTVTIATVEKVTKLM
eukprot:475679-Pelagomonas_calceolata.AAC.2